MLHKVTIDRLCGALASRGHVVFENDAREFNLNIVGIRSADPVLDQYRCALAVFWKYQGEWHLRKWTITTLPGKRYLVERLLNAEGCAILVEGQYRGVYALDLHGGRYEALCQRRGPVRVYRDGDRDTEFDFLPAMIREGWYGINIHAPITPRAGVRNYVADRVYASSAGCQVFRGMADFHEFRELCRSARQRFGNAFTYTLINERCLS